MHEMQPVDSSWVAEIGYNAQLREVHIALIDGRTYAYESVPPEVWRRFQDAESKGTFINEVLKPDYEFRRLSPG
jgi:hypothetical protein